MCESVKMLIGRGKENQKKIKNNKLCKKVAKKFGERKMFDVPLHRQSRKRQDKAER